MDYRAERMKSLIIQAFFDCLKEEDFSQITVAKLVDKAMINRSTFYRYFSDKYQLRDEIVDEIVKDFYNNMEVDFVNMDIHNISHTRSLENGLKLLSKSKNKLELLWNQKQLGRNVFDELISAGSSKVRKEIINSPTISDDKKKLADWYAELLVNNFLVSVRWWFSHSDTVSSHEITLMIKQHMLNGTIPTLKS